ncbi:hypothetical protein N0V93_004411 [Gnomoniopsis smithogilvyi]|uniref:RNA polymerase II subunit B1 CTD phosphatase RPAP2 homolog n=1 Tax=Gnomoniopsis smithogilvyi TaxID=1191159 RepID=A0A9W9CW64_9PEZI|nr:hypothetical protein N0V93_004411 [Gnomoniopsis smithogilvyi]
MASDPKVPLKGILKKPASSATPTSSLQGPPNPHDDARTVALHHANLLQTRKDTEAAILDNLLALLDLPQHTSHPPSSPHPADVTAFNELLRPFQPSDYDDLITERNLADNRCGYALCPNRRRRLAGAGTYKMVNKGRRDFDIVETRELERWCSTECTRRALWVKVQLNETAAWERVGLPELKVELYPEKDAGKDKTAADGKVQSTTQGQDEAARLAKDVASLQLEEDRKAAQDQAALAVERGDNARDVSKRQFDLAIREKKVVTQAEAPSLGTDPVKEGSIEGYRPKFGGVKPDDAAEGSESEDWVAI